MMKKIIASFAACAILSLMLFTEASAQLRGPLTITNNTNCGVVVCTSNGAACAIIPPGSTTIQIPCNTTAVGIRSCGTLRIVQLGQCEHNVPVANGCCADVCFSPGIVACTFFLTINPVPGPCPCPLG